MNQESPAILSPSVAASRIGVTVPELVAWIRVYRYDWSEIKVGGKPGDRGRNRWGLTGAQVDAIVRGQARRFNSPEVTRETPEAPRQSSVSPDGKSRLRKGRGLIKA